MATRSSINRSKWVYPLWCLLAVTACSTHPGAVDREACHAAKGTVEVVFGVRTCVVEFADGGQPCANSSDCEGRCIADFDASANPVPACSSNNLYHGCFAYVEDGVVPDEYRCSP